MENLPDLIINEICCYLDAKALSYFSAVCHRFYNFINTDIIWYKVCQIKNWTKFGTTCDITHMDSILFANTNVSGTSPNFPYDLDLDHTHTNLLNLPRMCKWHQVYLKSQHLDKNWRKGKYLVSGFLRGHETGKITGLDCCEDFIVSGATDGVLCLWQLSRLQLIRQTATTSGVTCLRLPDVDRLFVGLEVGGVCLYDPKCMMPISKFHHQMDEVITFQLIDRLLISVGTDKIIQVWDLATGQLTDKRRGHTDDVTCLTVQADSGLVGSGSWDGEAVVWRANYRYSSLSELCRLNGHTEAVSCLRLLDPLALTGSHDGSVRLWTLVDGLCLSVMEGHTEVYCLDVFDDFIVSGGSDSMVRVWKRNGDLLHTLEGHFGVVRFVSLSQQRLISAGDVRKIIVWDPVSGDQVSVLHRNPSQVGHLWTSDTGMIVASPAQPGTISVISYW